MEQVNNKLIQNKKIWSLLLLLIYCLFTTTSALAQENSQNEEVSEESRSVKVRVRSDPGLKAYNHPIYVVDGKIVTPENFKNINSDNIKAGSVEKGEEAVKKYGNSAVHGVIIIEMKEGHQLDQNEGTTTEERFMILTDSSCVYYNTALYVVNGEIMPANFDRSSLDPNRIESVQVLKGDVAVKKYGREAEGGVVEITMKTKE